MIRAESQPDQPIGPRPKGFVRPRHGQAARALDALEGGYLRTAETHINAMSNLSTMDKAWRNYLQGALSLARQEFAAAEPLLLEAASRAPVADNTAGLHPHPESFRLAARALEKAGWLYRHQDRPDRAYHSHLSAYHIRNEHGSFEETWETATSLGHDADLAGKHADCQSWHRIAIQAAARAAEEPERRQAISFTNLSLSLIKSNLHEDAVAAARTARHWWHKHDMGSSAAARADLILGHALLRHGERLCEAGNTNAQAVLDDAMQLLTSAREALSAFGDDTSADVRWCDEQTDFAQRLRSSLEA